MQPLMITAACGQSFPPRDNPTPDNVDDVVRSVVAAAKAGAAIAQIRAPSKHDPVTGRPHTDPQRWIDMVSRIRDACDILIHACRQIGTGVVVHHVVFGDISIQMIVVAQSRL